jgi:polysaccharide chain length determinant protein (PEP-CTERM system associated)
VSAGIAVVLPSSYESEATLLIVQQQVSQRYVPSDTTTSVTDTVGMVTQEVLSHAKLLQVIDELGLYPDLRRRVAPERLVDAMRKNVAIEPLDPGPSGNFSAFKISFTAAEPGLAQRVATRLTSLFIEQNKKTRAGQAAATTEFLTQQLDAAKNRLALQGERLRDFKIRYPGELPEQQQSNIKMMSELSVQLREITARISRAQDTETRLESSLDANTGRLRAERNTLLVRYTPRHPKVEEIDRQITEWNSLLKRLKSGKDTSERPSKETVSFGEVDPVFVRAENDVAENLSERASLAQEQQRLRADIAGYQKRLNLAPVREQELAEMLRDYNSFSDDIKELQSRQLQSQLTTSVEQDQKGQHFRLLDPPTLPSTPSGPKRLKISAGGAAMGLLLGIGLAFLLDARDTSFHAEQSVRDRFKVPFVISVPLLLTPAEERSRQWKRSFEGFVGLLMTCAVLAAEFYVYRHR